MQPNPLEPPTLSGEIEGDGYITSHVTATPRPFVPSFVYRFSDLARDIHGDNVSAGWWSDLETGAPLDRNFGELLMLVCSELSEADEGYTDNLSDDKLPHRLMIEVELADAEIRIFDIAGSRNYDLTAAALDLIEHGPRRPEKWEGVSASLMKITNEISRAMEGDRKDAADKVLPHRKAAEVGLAAALLRIRHLGHRLNLDVEAAREDKRAFNAVRSDHRPENRRADGGKRY